jgi:hypothetical protein
MGQSAIVWEVNTSFQLKLDVVVTSPTVDSEMLVPLDEGPGPDPEAFRGEN